MKIWISSNECVMFDLEEIVTCLWAGDTATPELYVWLSNGVPGENEFTLNEDEGGELMDALKALRDGELATPGTNPDHDSLFTKFEQLEAHLIEMTQIAIEGTGMHRVASGALRIAKLIRAQVLK